MDKNMSKVISMVDLTKLKLSSVKFHEDMSEETACFSGILVENGVKVATVSNNGQGGCNNYDHYDHNKKVFINLYERYGQIDVDCHIMQLAEDWNFTTKNQNKNFVLRKGDNTYICNTVRGQSFTKLKKFGNYAEWIKGRLTRFKTEGHTVLNRNL